MNPPVLSAFDDVVEEFRDEFDALLRMLELSEGTFSMSIAVCNAPALREQLIAELQQRRTGLEQIALPAGIVDVYGFVMEHAQPGQSGGLLLTGLEASISSRRTDNMCLQSLNASRDLWEQRYHRPVVLWLPEYAVRELMEVAVDLWRYLSHRFSFVSHQPVLPSYPRDLPAAEFVMAANLSAEEKQARIAELRERLATADRTSPQSLPRLTNWTCELSALFLMTGELNAAKQVCCDLLPTAQTQNDEVAIALLKSCIADAEQASGNIDEAIRIRREDVLPAYKHVGEEREYAVTMGKIAGLLPVRGESASALAILRDDVLPVYERLGDKRERAATLQKIADILKIMGCYDEAIHIYRDQVLPVFELLSDIHSQAVTSGRIANLLQERGDLDEALRIRRDVELPVYEQLGDARAQAVTKGQIADVLVKQGQVEQAVYILRHEVLPVFERLQYRSDQVTCQVRIAAILLRRNQGADRRRARELLAEALKVADELKLPQAEQIRRIQKRNGW